MIRKLIFAVLIIVSPPAWSNGTGTSPADSIIALLPTLTGQEKLDAYTALDFELNHLDDINTHIHYINQYIAEARLQKNIHEESYAHMQKLSLFDNRNLSDSLWHYAPGTLNFLEKHNEWNYYYYITTLLNTDLMMRYRIDEAFQFTSNCYEKAKQNKSDKGLGVALSNTGRIYHHIENMQEAERQYREAIAILSKTDEKAVLYDTYSHLAEILSFSGRYQEKLDIIHQWESALAEKLTASQAPGQWFNLYLEYANAHAHLGNYDPARHYLQLAKEMPHAQTTVGKVQIDNCQLYLHEQLGEYDQALALTDSVNNIYIALNGYPYAQMLEAKIRIARLKGDLDLALNTYDILTVARDSIQRVEMNARLDEIRTQYEVDRHVAEKTRNRTYALLFAIAFVLALVALAIWIGYSRSLRRKNIRLVAQIQEQDRLRREKETLQTRLSTRREPGTGTLPAAVEDDLFQRLEQLMKTNKLYLDPNLNIKTLLPLLGTNERYLREAIREQTNATFLDYINDLRLTFSRQLLEDVEKYTIEAIATESGFNSRSTCHRVFRDKYGLAPDEYRKLKK